ncbi:flagellar biosynthesis protein FliQ [Pseudokordiimonas caeni]|uniref:flagellar biosynthesis protein FliQ n=1 Tax=Pseudokordiimonas caeni TaxID=2997908 RepID=UPI002810FC57|nr:flagellar biosynthesis protein FliQ [Pseudokordiimonas caeni]
MTGPDVLDVARDAMTTLLILIAPVLSIGLFIGLTIAFFQAVTQINEMTLTFVPKIIAVFTGLLFLMPMMGRQLSGLMERIADRIIAGG